METEFYFAIITGNVAKRKRKKDQCYKLKSDILNHYRDQKLSAKAEASILDAIKYKKQFQLNTLRVLQGSSSNIFLGESNKSHQWINCRNNCCV